VKKGKRFTYSLRIPHQALNTMLRNYLKTALRNLLRSKLYSLINIIGLAVGISFSLLIILFVTDEWSFDRFHPDADRIYRVAARETEADGRQSINVSTSLMLGPMLKENLPEAEAFVRVDRIRNMVRRGERVFQEDIHLADSNFFEVFNFPLIKGNPATVLAQPFNLVLTESAARKYFGSTDEAFGSTLTVRVDGNNPYDFTVAGIAQDVPTNSSIRFEYLIPFSHSRKLYSEKSFTSLFQIYVETYVRLTPEHDLNQAKARMQSAVKNVLGDRYREDMYTVLFQPITDIRLNTDFPEGMEPISDPAYSYILGTLALFVLLIAGINFITLSLGRSMSRAKEVGIRKVVGAVRSQLIGQFWGEAVITSLLALMLGVVLAKAALPVFNSLAGKTLSYPVFSTYTLGAVVLAVLVGLLAGAYPALFLSRFNPVAVLKGKSGEAGMRPGARLQQGLVVLQFTLSIGLIICTLLMSQQLRFLQHKNLGFDREQLVVIPTGVPYAEAMPLVERFKNELGTHTAVADISAAVFTLGEEWIWAQYHSTDGVSREFRFNVIDPDFIPTLRMDLAAGRNFSPEISSDSSMAIIVNEALVAEYGWDDPIGQQLPGKNFRPHQVIGVVKDFNFQSLHTPVQPLILAMNDEVALSGVENVTVNASSRRKIIVRIKPGDVPGTLALLESTWTKIAPNLPYAYSFMDEALNRQYQAEQRLGNIMQYATGFAVFIACLGLFSLATLVVQKRQKDIGIRKVLGASVESIVLMFLREFLRLIALAFLIATPLAYLAMHHWLQDFAYRIPVRADTFLLAAMLVAGIAVFTVAFQVIKAALANPVKSLRSE
jgi:putative ABC transport system permease protein